MIDLLKVTAQNEKNYAQAAEAFTQVLDSEAPVELKRTATLELALMAQSQNQFVKAQQMFNQYAKTYRDDPSVPEVNFNV